MQQNKEEIQPLSKLQQMRKNALKKKKVYNSPKKKTDIQLKQQPQKLQPEQIYSEIKNKINHDKSEGQQVMSNNNDKLNNQLSIPEIIPDSIFLSAIGKIGSDTANNNQNNRSDLEVEQKNIEEIGCNKVTQKIGERTEKQIVKVRQQQQKYKQKQRREEKQKQKQLQRQKQKQKQKSNQKQKQHKNLSELNAINKAKSNQAASKKDSLRIPNTTNNSINATMSIEQPVANVQKNSEVQAVKVIIKEAQLIKQTVANLQSTVRGLEYIQRRVKVDRRFRAKIKNKLYLLREIFGA